MVIYLIVVIIGALLFMSAVARLKSKLAFVKNGERATGTIVRVDEKINEDGTYYYPVFDIPSAKHGIMTYSHSTGRSTPVWQVGDTAAFIFMPGKPDTVRFLKYTEIFWGPMLLLATAADLLLIGGGYFLIRGLFGF